MTKEEFLSTLIYDSFLGEQKSECLLQFVLNNFNTEEVSEALCGELEISEIAASLVYEEMYRKCDEEFVDFEINYCEVSFDYNNLEFKLSNYEHDSKELVDFCKNYINNVNSILKTFLK